MKITQITVGCRLSHNYNSYECTETIEIEDDEQSMVADIRKAAQVRVRNAVKEEMGTSPTPTKTFSSDKLTDTQKRFVKN